MDKARVGRDSPRIAQLGAMKISQVQRDSRTKRRQAGGPGDAIASLSMGDAGDPQMMQSSALAPLNVHAEIHHPAKTRKHPATPAFHRSALPPVKNAARAIHTRANTALCITLGSYASPESSTEIAMPSTAR